MFLLNRPDEKKVFKEGVKEMRKDQGVLETASPPWGEWQVILDQPGYKVKQIKVDPGQKLSYQKHAKRREHWLAVQGEGLIILEGKEYVLLPGDSIDVPVGMPHRVTNPGELPFVFIEVQMGQYLGENDIIRIEDDYGRATEG